MISLDYRNKVKSAGCCVDGCEWVIYILRDHVGDVRYVGKTSRFHKRQVEHLRRPPLKDQSYRAHWLRSMADYGQEPTMEIIETGTGQGDCEAEIRWIAYFRQIGARLTNSTQGGEGIIPLTPEIREKIAAAARRPHSPEWRYRSAQAHRDLRRKLTPEHKAKWMAGRNAYIITPERREQLRQLSTGRTLSVEARRKISDAHKGKTVSEETRAKLSIACSGRKHTDKERARMARAWEHRKLSRTSHPEMGIGRARSGELNPAAKITAQIVRQIRAEHSSVRGAGKGYRVLGRKYDMPWESIRNIVKRHIWSHVP